MEEEGDRGATPSSSPFCLLLGPNESLLILWVTLAGQLPIGDWERGTKANVKTACVRMSPPTRVSLAGLGTQPLHDLTVPWHGRGDSHPEQGCADGQQTSMLPDLQQVERALEMCLSPMNRCRSLCPSAVHLFSLGVDVFPKCTGREGDKGKASQGKGEKNSSQSGRANRGCSPKAGVGLETPSQEWPQRLYQRKGLFPTSVGPANRLKRRYNGNGLKRLPELLNH